MLFPNLHQFCWCKQTVLAMKLTAILIVVACLQVSARGYTQENITLNEKNAELTSVFKKITNQTGVHFAHRDEWIRDAKPVNISVQNADLKTVLQKLFAGQPGLTYEFVGENMVTVKKRDGGRVPEGLNNNDVRSEAIPIDISGKVVNEKGDPVEGVTVTVKGTKVGTSTNAYGEFFLSGVDPNAVLVFTGVSIETFELKVNGKSELLVNLKAKSSELDSVVVHTGYQTLKPNEVTGSVVVLKKEQLDQRVAPDIISKLEGITNGLVFNKSVTGENSIRIRGESTLFGYADPLIIVDNFAFVGDISSINPNDVESITILKDASAASIWGVRAGNGVIVITTKKGKLNQPLRLSVTANTTIGEKPDLFYRPQVNSTNFIDLETFLFGKGFYNSTLTSTSLPAVSPVVEILNRRKLGQISAADSASQIDALRSRDYRDDFSQYLYQKAITQQYHVGLRGGSNKASYSFSAGYDSRRMDMIGNSSRRITLSNQTTFIPVKNFEMSFGLNYIENSVEDDAIDPANYYPYTTLFDANGNQLPIRQHRDMFEDTIGSHGFLDWKYYPLQERNYRENQIRSYVTGLQAGLRYSIVEGLNIDVSYNYQRVLNRDRLHITKDAYSVRNNINKFALVTNGNYMGTNYPVGGNLTVTNEDRISHSLRSGLSFRKRWSNHFISILSGVEVREIKFEATQNHYLGYNDENGSFANPVDTTYRAYLGNGVFANSKLGIQPPTYRAGIERFRSFFMNAAYAFNERYTFSTSVRADATNFFGVKTNNKIVPLWSTGFKWDISKETFYRMAGLPSLSFRLTYGYQGNLNHALPAVATIRYGNPSTVSGLPTASIANIPNPQLRWEKIGQFNAGIDFATRMDRVVGSVEFYHKTARDLIGDSPLDPTTGVNELRGNFSGMRSNGLDISISARIIDAGIKWSSTLIFNYVNEIVTQYDVPSNAEAYLGAFGSVVPQEGKPVYRMYSYRWAGLDPNTGDPRIYMSDTINKTYTSANLSNIKETDLIYSGRSNPPIFGAFSNTFSWKGLSLTMNIAYKFNYYFRRNSVIYTNPNTWRNLHSDFALRWQKPGDELLTSVPSLVYPIGNGTREVFYRNSDILVERGDHIRLQYLHLGYTVSRKLLNRIKFQDLQFYFYMNNIGILWRANDRGIDPDNQRSEYPIPRSYSLGLKLAL